MYICSYIVEYICQLYSKSHGLAKQTKDKYYNIKAFFIILGLIYVVMIWLAMVQPGCS